MADKVELQAETRQLVRPVTGEGVVSTIRKNRVGELVVADPIEQMIIDGDVFMCSNNARETHDELGNGAFADTEPALAIDIPSGTSIKPLEFMSRQGGTVASTLWTCLITVDTAVRITSGVAVVVNNFRINASPPKATACTVKKHKEGTTNLLVGANTEDFTLFAGIFPADLDGLEGAHIFYSHKEHITPWIVGPGSLTVYLYCATQEPDSFWHLIWAEKDTADLIA